MTRIRTLVVPAALVLAVSFSACGGRGGEDAGDDDVASLGGEVDDTGDDPGGGGDGGRPDLDPEFQDAMVEFAECMREHGVDMPDPEFGDGGMVIMGGGPAGADGERPSPQAIEEMEAAQEACQPIMDEVEAQMPEPDPEQVEEMRRQALEFAECMREHGIDMPDPQFSDDGGVSIAIGDPGGDARPSVDFDDPEFQEAQEECGGEGGFMVGGPAPAEDE